MLSDKSKIPIKTSNPIAAFQQLEGNAFRVHRPHESALVRQQSTQIDEIESILVRAETVVRTDEAPESKEGPDCQVPSSSIDGQHPDQSQQLVGHLKQKERSLAEQDADYHVRVWNWQQQVAQTQKTQDRRETDLNEQETQLRALQFELLQLQDQLIDSQLATREIVSQLQLPGQESSAIVILKSELNQRFDHVMVTWRGFADHMQNLAHSISDQVEGERNAD